MGHEKYIRNFSLKCEGMRQAEDLGIDVRIISKWTLG